MGNRKQTEFYETDNYSKGMDDLQSRDAKRYKRVLAKMEKFEEEYQNTIADPYISAGFDVKPIDNQPGKYQLKQVRLTNDFRAAIIVPDGRTEAWWCDSWKKTAQINQRDIRAAQKRAKDVWETEIK